MERKPAFTRKNDGSRTDVEEKLGQMKQKLSSFNFIDAIDKELGLSQADEVAAS